ncbi:HIRAN domain-containing protein [Sphingobium yanoikuyae]|uniref:HIRAN domain-containing protein n=1 Tax=Sphingobium yanoikuyae TaxID=13690 RepID=A0A291N2U4_SPHYA|nr:HIRAN domain-containing protein [Sphingobium yanoikuyae]ATI81448.1 hypothetical protein A6768_16580 [Sphingobium yanoikuyae]
MVTPVGRLPAMSLAVVGARFPNSDGSDRRREISLCSPGEPVELRPEPHNKADARAVAVISCRGVQIGYLTAERCGRVSQLLEQCREVQAIFQRASPSGAWIRAGFDGETPQLLATIADDNETLDNGADTGFYPDEIWPDD